MFETADVIPGLRLYDLTSRALRSMRHGSDALVMPIVFPLCILAINVKAVESIIFVAGFPSTNVTNFAIALTFLQGAIFAGIACAARMAYDIESGFIRRIAVTPVSMGAVLGARLVSVAVVSVIQTTCYLIVAVADGATIAAGPGGVVAIFVLALMFNTAFAGLGIAFAVRTKSGEAVQSLFPIFFVLVMASSALMPRNLIEVSWFRAVADANPISYMLEAIRSLFIRGWNAQALELGVGMAVVMLSLTTVYVVWDMRRVVTR